MSSPSAIISRRLVWDNRSSALQTPHYQWQRMIRPMHTPYCNDRPNDLKVCSHSRYILEAHLSSKHMALITDALVPNRPLKSNPSFVFHPSFPLIVSRFHSANGGASLATSNGNILSLQGCLHEISVLEEIIYVS
ncbi:hypothetical protein B0O99DRAFT_144643 [Bisporella sp. PMI_857]|nr:hypothetical protein B0O99DRAFT_144643 [Bisporella sp. PMI_857]